VCSTRLISMTSRICRLTGARRPTACTSRHAVPWDIAVPTAMAGAVAATAPMATYDS
jgi:hypothetical protein